MKDPLVSICIASYNHGRFMPGLLESLINQTYPNIEVVLVDDCSTDDTWAVVESYRERLSQRFPSVKLLRNDVNKNYYFTGEKAIKQATGDYISYLESDDFYFSTKVEENVRFLQEHPDFVAVHSDFIVLDEQGRITQGYWRSNGRAHSAYPDGITYSMPSGWIREELLGNNCIGTLSLMAKRDEFLQCWLFSESLRRGDILVDYAAHLRMSKLGQIGYIDKILGCYRQLSNSLTNDQSKRDRVLANTERIKADAAAGLI
jgi:glycosyltransferase involved in cell wall biosynthesis